MAGHTPVFNLSAVIRATGLSADVLRAWERRYGLPRPQRTPGGHRLYSEWDIEVIRWLKARQAEGLTISRAADLWKETVGAGADPQAAYPPASVPPGLPPVPTAEGRVEALQQAWLSASLAFDSLKADDILNQAFAVHPVETVLTDLLQKAISEIGDRWYRGEVTEQQEHFASGLAMRRLEALIAAAPHPTRPQTVCVGCPPGEWHTLPLQLLGLLLQRRGLSVLYLGADLPVEQLAETASVTRPDLVILAAQRLATAASLRAASAALQESGVPLAYGGLVFSRMPGLREHIPAYYLGESLEASRGAIEQLLSAPAPYPTRVEALGARAALAREYRERQASIELSAARRLHAAGLDAAAIRRANDLLGSGLGAALELGDPAFLEADIEWAGGLSEGRRIPPEELEACLRAYAQAARRELGEDGAPISEWVSAYLAARRHRSEQEAPALVR